MSKHVSGVTSWHDELRMHEVHHVLQHVKMRLAAVTTLNAFALEPLVEKDMHVLLGCSLQT